MTDKDRTPLIGRRSLIAGASSVLGSLAFPRHIARAASPLITTPGQMEGPFYPVDWLGDTDNDLVIVTGEAARSLGQVVHLDGHVRDIAGNPVGDAMIEIWQCDARGVYRHPGDNRGERQPDPGFQGRGRTRTDAAGKYSFRTIRPVPYPGRTPHIHFAVVPRDGRSLITQMYVFGEDLNARDGLFNAIPAGPQRESVLVRLERANGIEAGALAGTFDIVIG